MNTENTNKYFITYSNHFKYAGRTLAFRKQLLFDITDTPKYIPYNQDAQSWIVNRQQLSKKRASELINQTPIKIDVSDLQWYKQIELQECFNLQS